MNEEPQHGSGPQDNPPAPQPPAPRSNKRTWVIAGILALAALCLGSLVCAGAFGTGMYMVFTEKAPIESVLDAYMRHMADRDAEGAYSLFSPRAQRQIPLTDVEELLEGSNFILFEGYRSLSVSDLNISAQGNADPDLPQGIVAEVNGVILFDEDIQGSFEGVLEKVDGRWMIDGMYVTVPPSKIK